MIKRNILAQNVLLCFILSMLLFPVANAGLVEVYMNESNDDLVIAEVDPSIPYGTNIILEFHIRGVYMMNSDNDEKAVQSMNIDIEFLSDEDSREACRACANPNYIKPKDNEQRDYDVYQAKFYSDSVSQGLDGYVGDIRFNIVMLNRNSTLIPGADTTILLTIEAASTKETSSGFSLPEIPTEIMDNLIIIIAGLVGIIILSFGIYTFVLAPEDTTASLYKTKESIDPLSKSLTGVGYQTELPSESKLKRLEDSKTDSDEEEVEDDEYEDYDDEEDQDFNESELLAKLTGGNTLRDTKGSDDEDEPEVAPVPKKKPIKRTITKKGVAKKKVVRKAAPPTNDVPNVNMGKGITAVTCPSCNKVHHIDENTPKFICSCGRRTRV
ncbi:MAG TPA: hypothetical protein EYQ70_01055 [Marine Group III euryarchaeote]|jgi:hypothetical protein|uniref:Uncharacterized protein n=1 Tax=Marine Group III euryarchaeote TaxID=2173149 RepID=A0A7J4GR55_9ARCH|nr:hypothetical protein [Marine Group III euryarchaeote]